MEFNSGFKGLNIVCLGRVLSTVDTAATVEFTLKTEWYIYLFITPVSPSYLQCSFYSRFSCICSLYLRLSLTYILSSSLEGRDLRFWHDDISTTSRITNL